MHKICKKYNNEREKDKETKHNKKYTLNAKVN